MKFEKKSKEYRKENYKINSERRKKEKQPKNKLYEYPKKDFKQWQKNIIWNKRTKISKSK